MIRYDGVLMKLVNASETHCSIASLTTHNALVKLHMHNLECTSTWGNFEWTAKVEVTEEQAVILANAGLLQILQRSPASKAEKAMANNGAGYEKRPEGFVRSSIEFSDANATTLAKFLGETIEIAKDVKITPLVKAVYHEIGATKEPVYFQEKQIVQKHIDAKDVVTWAVDKIGYTGGGELNADNIELLKAVKEFKNRLIAEQL